MELARKFLKYFLFGYYTRTRAIRCTSFELVRHIFVLKFSFVQLFQSLTILLARVVVVTSRYD